MRKILLISLLLPLLLISPKQAFADNSLNVYYAGSSGTLSTALTLDSNVRLVSEVSAAEVFVLNGEIPDGEAIRARVEQGAGLVLILGPHLAASQINSLLGEMYALITRKIH